LIALTILATDLVTNFSLFRVGSRMDNLILSKD